MTAIAIVAIICWLIYQVYHLKTQRNCNHNEEEIAELHQQIDLLKQRIETLEKIATDPDEKLKRDIDEL